GLMRGLVGNISKRVMQRLVDPQIRLHLDFWDAELAKSIWFAGKDFTGADIMMSFPLEVAAHRADAKSRPMVKGFLDRIHARPAYQQALKSGGAYDYSD